MFTGIVQDLGKVTQIKKSSSYLKIFISSDSLIRKIDVGDSVAINGVCQTVTDIGSNFFSVDAINETIKKTTLKKLVPNSIVNLELALTPNSRIGGHFVQGHIDYVGSIKNIIRSSADTSFFISFEKRFRKFLAPTGSVTVDGASLTTAEIFENYFKVAIIPHTIKSTLFHQYRIGDEVNLEFDIIGKYVDTILLHGGEKDKSVFDIFLSQ